MKQPKFEIGQRVLVEDIYKNLVLANVLKIIETNGVPDYLCKPINYPSDDLCGCGETDCGGVSWFLESDVRVG